MKSGPLMCPHVENPDLVLQKTGYSQSLTHSWPAECDSRQTIQVGPDHQMNVSPSRGLPNNMFLAAPTPSGPVCHQVQQQTTTICLTSSRLPSMGNGCTQLALGRSKSICLPTGSHLGQSGVEVAELPVQQNHTDCTRVAQHALVLGSSDNVQSDPIVPAQSAQSVDSVIQPAPTQESFKSESACLAPRASEIKEQVFSEAVVARIEAPQRGWTRSV